MQNKIAILLIIVLGINSQFLLAAGIDTLTAAKVALSFYKQQKPGNYKSSITLKLAETYNATFQNSQGSSDDETPLFYIYKTNDDAGFVIVAADDNISPVLGYSTSGSFTGENLPPALSEFLENWKEEIKYVLINNFKATDEIKSKWDRLKNGEPEAVKNASAVVEPLLLTKWDQGKYYNAFCPYEAFHKVNALTGCVATAMAQIMKFWNYPAHGYGFHSYVHPDFGTLTANYAATTYNWAAMPVQVTDTNNAVATLMSQCGVSVDMNYSTGGSSAYYAAVVYALTAYFQYSQTVHQVQRYDYPNSAWLQLIKDELNAGRPMQYNGQSNAAGEGGHSFVCDGYDQNDYFHFNWGWSGSYDGYFKIDNLNPGSESHNYYQNAIVGIKPEAEGETSAKVVFNVDMTGQTVSADGVHLAGNFQGWNPSSTLMQPMGSNRYSCSVDLQSGTLAEYKYINGTTWGQVEEVPASCGLLPDGNRYYTVPNANIISLPNVAFSACGPFASNVYVTFNVDMTGQTISPEGVHIAGNFQGWNPSATLMTPLSGNIYTYTHALMPGTQAAYRFVNGATWNQGEGVPEACSLPGGNSRYITVPGASAQLPDVLFGTCESKAPALVNVTFNVNMNNMNISTDGIHFASDFQDWNPGTNLMTHTTVTNYKFEVALPAGSYHEYKFINGNHWGVDEHVPAACSQGNNRYIHVPDVDTVLTQVIFGSCEFTTSVNEPIDVTGNTLRLFPNPNRGKLEINSNSNISSIEVYDFYGKRIYAESKFNQQTSKELDLAGYPKGIYFIKVYNGANIQTGKIMIQ
jgi:hypothetical protein